MQILTKQGLVFVINKKGSCDPFFLLTFEFMVTVFAHLLTVAGTALISFAIAWLKKKADIKDVVNGNKGITEV